MLGSVMRGSPSRGVHICARVVHPPPLASPAMRKRQAPRDWTICTTWLSGAHSSALSSSIGSTSQCASRSSHKRGGGDGGGDMRGGGGGTSWLNASTLDCLSVTAGARTPFPPRSLGAECTISLASRPTRHSIHIPATKMQQAALRPPNCS
eukprot:6172226-Pleurochrysis_carterae.AAC.2